MKRTILIMTLLMGIYSLRLSAQCGGHAAAATKPTSIGIVIYSNDIETVWNALRFANYSKTEGDTVGIFLLGKGVELENLVSSDKNIKEQTDIFTGSGGTILGCGTCLKSRNNYEPRVCKFSSMNDLYDLIRKNKTVLTF